jgi:hypothetical protein
MAFILSLGFQDLVDSQGQKCGTPNSPMRSLLTLFLARYALQLNDTVIVNNKRPATCLTDGLKKPKHVMFFSDDGSEEEHTKAPTKKGANGNPSPLKNKTAGGKVLRNKTRNAGQEEPAQSTAAKISDHQRELHAQLHKNGLAKYSESGAGAGGKEGQGWKKFQSYKGELGLPKEVEGLRVSILSPHGHGKPLFMFFRSSLIEKRRPLSCPFMALPSLSISTRSRMSARATRVIRHSFASTSKHRARLPARRKTRCECRLAPCRDIPNLSSVAL